MSELQQIVLIHRFKGGDIDYLICGDEGVRVFVVDENAPNDRVYEMTSRCDAEEIKAVIGDSPIGSANDDSHAAIAHKIKAAMDGRPRLSIVKSDEASNE